MRRFLRRRKKGRDQQPPSNIDVKRIQVPAISTAAAAATATSGTNTAPSSSGGHGRDDGVSVMTPATGMPPDDLNRPLLLGITSCRDQPHDRHPQSRLPSNGGSLPFGHIGNRGASYDIDVNVMLCDDVSTVTGGMPSPARGEGVGVRHGYGGRVGNRHGTNLTTRVDEGILLPGEDDDDDRLTVYEEDGSNSVGGYDVVNRAGMTKGSAFGGSHGETAPAATIQGQGGRKSSSFSSSYSSTSWLTRTRYFQRAIDAAFDGIDVDKSGDVTLEELYSGLLLIHLQMAAYVGASACRPASKRYVTEIFRLLDRNDSGVLTREEFSSVMKILYSQVFTRIVIQWSLTLMIVPVISKYVIGYSAALLHWTERELSTDILDDDYSVVGAMKRLIWMTWALFLSHIPRWMSWMGRSASIAIGMIPSGMLLTIATVAQTSVALPYALGRVEDFFMWAANGKVK